jgi:hypothetical protein
MRNTKSSLIVKFLIGLILFFIFLVFISSLNISPTGISFYFVYKFPTSINALALLLVNNLPVLLILFIVIIFILVL